jgi:threonine/homoserine/homoserine lactone efflux protein
MPGISSILLFVLAGLALNITPGPDMLYVIARSASEGRKAGIVSALGIATGTLVHISLVAGGLAGLLRSVPIAFAVVKYAGAAYLVYLGLRVIFANHPMLAATDLPPARLGALYRQGVLTNVLNPKVALFFLALLPQFVDPTRGPVAAQVIFLGMLFNTTGTIVNCIVAVASSRIGTWTRTRVAAARRLQRITGGVFIALGVRLAFVERH